MNLLDVIREDNIALQQSGSRWVAACPFHEGDRDPSFTVYPTESYFCFACGAWGNVVQWLTDYRKMSFNDALTLLGRDYKPRKRASVIKIRSISKAYPFLSHVSSIYHQFLLTQPGALKYLKTRGLTDDTIKRYRVGYTDGNVLGFSTALEQQLAIEIGLVTESGWEVLSHRITVPNLVGRDCDYIMGRTVINSKPKYLGIHTPKPIQGFYEVKFSPIIFVVEGHFDWLILRQWGYPAIAVGGAHLTKANRELLKSHKLVLIPDNDPEGERVVNRLQADNPSSYILDYTKYGVKDIGEFALLPNAEREFETLVRSQLPWLITSTSPTALMTYFPTSLGLIQ